MNARDRHEFEYRRRLEAEQADESDEDPAEARPAQRLENQALWVDLQIRLAMERGEFDDLPGAGKPLRGLDGPHDPNWWVKNLIEREQISVLPAALALRLEDADLDETLDRWSREQDVRQAVEDFNRRVVDARRQLQGGPPVITSLRDADTEVRRWSERRSERLRVARARAEDAREPRPRRRWWPRHSPD